VQKIFGIPAGSLLVVLVVAVTASLAVVGVLAARNSIFLRLAVRNGVRRRARTALIVVGLMLGTTIISAALVTGDTMSTTIRSAVVYGAGDIDEIVQPKQPGFAAIAISGGSTGNRWFSESSANHIARVARRAPHVDGAAPAVLDVVAVQDVTRRQNEPRLTLFASDPKQLGGFGTMIRRTDGRTVSLAALGPGQVYLDAHASDNLHARPGDRILVLIGSHATTARVAAVVRYDGNGSATGKGAVLMPLRRAQLLLGHPGKVPAVIVSNRGGAVGGAKYTDDVVRELTPAIAPLGLEATSLKQDLLDMANKTGNAFMSMFTTFGSFSIAAGILLIFLIFVMLAAERRSELGISRAVGMRRGHVVQLFVFEGLAYDLLAALVGAALGTLVALGMVAVLSAMVDSSEVNMSIQFAASPRSLVIAYGLGVLLTLLVVAVSAWRVSSLNIATAIRDLPPPPPQRLRRRRLILAGIAVGVGALMAISGASAKQFTPLALGISLVIIGLVPLTQALGAPERLAYTIGGLLLVVGWLLPWDVWEWAFGNLKMDFSAWIASGLMIVIGAVWTIVYNADVLSRAALTLVRGMGGVVPTLKMAMAYPLASRFRTGVTLAMFTLVVFTLVTGTTISASFINAYDNANTFGGGWDVRASVATSAPIKDMRVALRKRLGVGARDFPVVGSASVLPVDARQLGSGRPYESYVVRGFDRSYLTHTTYGLGATAHGYRSAKEVWHAIASHPGLAVVDPLVVAHRANFNFSTSTVKFKLSGFYAEDKHFAPVRVVARDPQTGRRVRLTIIGVLKDSATEEMAGMSTSQATLAPAFPGRVDPTVFFFRTRPGVDPTQAATRLESAFLGDGMQADAITKLLHDAVSTSLLMNRLIQGFMGLGLLVGVAALGVISARAVVERRQQIGVLRAIGFPQRMVEASFLLESSVVALTAILVGAGLGLVLAYNLVSDMGSTPGSAGVTLTVPWVNLAVIFLVVYAVALLTTLAPARRAARIYPAQALRYE
jgi:putative ABC transport system permease protein